MQDNTTIADNGAEVYTDRIFELADDYISTLRDVEELYKPNSNQFTGMIKYINRNIHFNRSILADINILNIIPC